MSDLPPKYQTFAGPLLYVIEKVLYTKSRAQQDAVVSQFMEWLQERARLKPVPNLQDNIVGMEKKLRKMAENLEIEFVEGKLVIRSDAESMTLLRLLRRGSSWFDPHPGVDETILFALIKGAS